MLYALLVLKKYHGAFAQKFHNYSSYERASSPIQTNHEQLN